MRLYPRSPVLRRRIRHRGGGLSSRFGGFGFLRTSGCQGDHGHEKEGGFGFKIIQILVQQINAKLFYEYENGLSTFKITLKNAY